jgi:hypothetical protein
MTETVDYISINDIFWIQLKSHLVSFGFKSLPDNIHFTISFDDRSPDINLHITKNVTDFKNKPKIRIVCIDKILLEEILPSLSVTFLNRILQPIDLVELKNKYNNHLGFISFDNFEYSKTYSLTEQKLIDSFKDIAKFKRKTRLKIEGNIENRLEIFATSEDLQKSMFDNMVELTTEFQKPVDGGIIISNDNVLQVIRFNDKWFKIRKDLNHFDLLKGFINKKLESRLIYKTKRALVGIKYAETYSDTRELDKPIRLIREKNN